MVSFRQRRGEVRRLSQVMALGRSFARDAFAALLALGALTTVSTAGCRSPAWQEARAQGEKALQNSKAAFNAVNRALIEDSSKLGVESSATSLEATRSKLKETQAQIAALHLPSAAREWWDQNVAAQIAKIDAALALQDIRSQWQALAGETSAATLGAKTAVDAELARLRESSPAFQALDDKLKAAEQAYRDAVARAAEALRAPAPEQP